MAVDFETPSIPKPYRVIFMGAAVDGWLKADDDERREVVLPRAKAIFTEEWPQLGARVLCTLDDDLFNVGPPATSDFTWYLIYELDDLNLIPAMLHCLRRTVDGARLDRYLRIEAKVGRPFFILGGV